MSVPHYAGISLQNPTGATTKLSEVPEDIEIIPVQITAEDGAPSRALLYRRRGTRPKVGVHLMHPRTDQGTNYNILPLVKAGCAVIGRASRWPNNDVNTIHEVLLIDMAAGVRFLRDQGCEKVVLLGNSGGGSLAAFYQAQAEAPAGHRLKETPAGEPLDLNKFHMPAADGVVLVGAHSGQGMTMEKVIDPSVVDEDDPLATDPDLDMYNPSNGFVPPPASSRYSAEFLGRYKAAQIARIKRLDEKARSLLVRRREAAAAIDRLGDAASLQQRRAAIVEHHMVVYRTAAYPAFVDLSIDPDSRTVFSYFGPRPDLENYGGEGFARYITPSAWLSTWSSLSSNAKTIANLTKVRAPLLIVQYDGDCGCRLSEIREIFEAAGSVDKLLHVVQGADHYGLILNADGSKGHRSTEGTEMVVAWVQQRFLG